MFKRLTNITLLPQRYRLLTGIAAALYLGLSLLAWYFFGSVTLIFSLTVALVLAILLSLAIFSKFRSIVDDLFDAHYRQVEALFSIFNTLRLEEPLPPMRGWAVSPDFASLVIRLIREQKPTLMVEVGSGVSTFLSALYLKQLDHGQMVSIEHDENYATACRAHIAANGLENVVTLIHAPLIRTTVDGDDWTWYDTKTLEEKLRSLPPIDLLIVDGPPFWVQALARYPALPVLFKYLDECAIVALDDADREDERMIVSLWQKRFSGFELEEAPCEKGAVIFRRTVRDLQDG